MHVLSTRAVLLFRISYIYGSHHTITSMLKYIHSSAQTCGRVGRQRYCLGRFGGHPPAPPSSYALRRHGSHRLLFTPKLTTTYMAGGARHQPSRWDSVARRETVGLADRTAESKSQIAVCNRDRVRGTRLGSRVSVRRASTPNLFMVSCRRSCRPPASAISSLHDMHSAAQCSFGP